MQRRPATEARLLYAEDEATIKRREEIVQLNKAAQIVGEFTERGRPTKRNRRLMDEFKRQWG